MIPPRTILAATDFSDPSRAALVFAARAARHHQAALHVVPRRTSASSTRPPAIAAPIWLPRHARSLETGSVPDRLAAIAGRAADRAPLLVLGKKAPHSGGGAPGTIAYRVLSLTDVPVLMVVD
jgi:hypothetical protein